jgi:TPR repeat protein
MRKICVVLTLLVAGAGPACAAPVDEARSYLRGGQGAGVDLPKAFSLFSGAAKAGDPQAGMSVPRDAKAAVHWLQFAANRQMPAAMFALANLYLSGDGVKRDEQAARRLIEKAADLEYPDAVMAMAIGLRDGSMGFERNEALAETQMRFANRALKQKPTGGM